MTDQSSDRLREDSLYVRLSKAQVASCHCGTKTHEIEYHDELCPYRLYQEAAVRIAELARELSQLRSAQAVPDSALLERVAQLTAHRACCGIEHDPANGKLHGFCVVCGIPWPCEYAGCRASSAPAAPAVPPPNTCPQCGAVLIHFIGCPSTPLLTGDKHG